MADLKEYHFLQSQDGLLWNWYKSEVCGLSILKEISPGCSLEGMMLKLKLQYFGYLMKNWVIGKNSDAGRDWGQEEKGMTEDEMAGWHHWLDGRESEWTPGVGDGQGGLVCCDSWGRKESDTTERLNWTETKLINTQNRLVIARGWWWVVGKMAEGSQKVQTSSYKMKKPW